MNATTDDTRIQTGPKKFIVWLFIVASIMLFAALTSGYIVKKGSGNFGHYALPPYFLYNTVVILVSSVSLHFSLMAAKKLQISRVRLGLWITLFLALVFLAGQWAAWDYLVKEGVFFSGNNPLGSLLYVFSGLHGLHILAGIGMILYALASSGKDYKPSILTFRIEMASIFWHFLDILWIYLYVFLLLNQ